MQVTVDIDTADTFVRVLMVQRVNGTHVARITIPLELMRRHGLQNRQAVELAFLGKRQTDQLTHPLAPSDGSSHRIKG